MSGMSEGILKTRLEYLEQRANTAEAMALFNLTKYEEIPEEVGAKSRRYSEARIRRHLTLMDELQDEIDAVTAELKAAGWYESRPAITASKYEYKRPKAKPVPKPEPKQPAEVHSLETTGQRKRRLEQEAKEQRRREREELREQKAAEKAQRSAGAPKPKRAKPVRSSRGKESAELTKAKKGLYDAQLELAELEPRQAEERAQLEANIAMQEARLIEWADLSKAEHGPTKRFNARKAIRNAQTRLDQLQETYDKRSQVKLERIEKYALLIEELTASESQ